MWRPHKWSGWLIVVTLAVAATTVTWSLVSASAERRKDPGASAALANDVGGYRLEYPTSWTATAMGSTTKFTSPANDVVVGIGKAQPGPLRRAARLFAATVTGSYEGASVDGRVRQKIGDRDSVAFAGRATNASGTELRWLAVTVNRGQRNFGISVFTSDNSDPAAVLPLLHSLVASLEPLP